jgi:hypothetical protein
VDHLVTTLQRRHDVIPVTLDVGTVGVELALQSGVLEDAFAGRDVLADGEADPERYDADIGNEMHDMPFLAVGAANKIPPSLMAHRVGIPVLGSGA